ncbi:MFS general substrate transporter [Neolentinus lepideus HHB14362 ss-1]|uniref:MFS general substrate transporter n=1 Tax=Neolentinus lepideus HHB14362 ss-1 TaxID=1314782 RepID=A0A165QDG2_9AGAM|nr:MFS general substrate transporter [Neolentinus lepideus HHB14362 ss-1]
MSPGTDETSSLLSHPHITPLPKLQLATLFAIKTLIPLSATQVMPYINEMVEKFGLSTGADAGYYSGLVGSSFGIAQLLSMYYWGRLSDNIGRLPVILVGTLGVSITSTLFGLSRTFPMMLLTRFLSGIFCGTTGAIHSVVGELSDETNASTAFPLYDICSAIGFAVGPLIGGTFANPAEQYPAWFDTPFFRAYPYILPCFITALAAVVASLLAVFILEETLPKKRKDNENLPHEELTPPSVRTLLAIPVIRAICLSTGALGFVAGSFNHVFVLMAYAPLVQGGLALSPSQIGRAMFFMGTTSIFLKLCMPLLLRRFDHLRVFAACTLVWPFTFALMPVLNAVARQSQSGLLWAGIRLVLVMSRVGTMVFSIVMILVRETAPGPASLGTTNGLTEFVQSAFGSLSGVVISSLFAVSASKHLLGGQLWVVFSIVVALLASGFAERIRKHRNAPGAGARVHLE